MLAKDVIGGDKDSDRRISQSGTGIRKWQGPFKVIVIREHKIVTIQILRKPGKHRTVKAPISKTRTNIARCNIIIIIIMYQVFTDF